MYIVGDGTNGHFKFYEKILRSHTSIYFEYGTMIDILKLIKLIYKQKRKNQQKIIFLNAERHILHIIFLKFLFSELRVGCIVYYSFSESEITLRTSIKQFLLKYGEGLGVKLFGLEYYNNSFAQENLASLISLPDPILIDEALLPKCSPQYNRYTLKENQHKTTSILIYGYLDRRKCIEQVIDAIEHLIVSKRKSFKLKLLGQVDSSLKPSLMSRLQELKVKENQYFEFETKFEYFSNDTLATQIKNVDIIMAVYRQHFGSSGVVLNALAFKKNVIFIPIGVLKHLSEQLSFSNLPKSSDIKEISNSILFAINHKLYDYKKAEKYLQLRRPHNFKEIILSNIDD